MTNPSLSHILILDDEPSYSRSIARTLQTPHQFEVETASTPEEALQKAREASKQGVPFEVFLIDQNLHDEKTGIEVMQELKHITPNAEGVIFTGFDNTGEDGVRALQAGAFRYLMKPFPREELIYVLDAIRESRWQKVFSQMLEETLKKPSFQDTAKIVVSSAIKLGFKRAHLFWVPNAGDKEKGQNLVGVICSGRGCIPGFKNKLFPQTAWPALHRVKAYRNISFLPSIEEPESREHARSYGYEPATGEWVIIPIWSDQPLGLMLLDYGPDPRIFTDYEKKSIAFFARQVSAMLERARIFEREQRSRQETITIGNIGRQVTAHASTGDLKSLLEQVREQVRELINVDNFKIILTDEEVGAMEFPLHYRNGIRQGFQFRPLHSGLEGHLLDRKEAISFSHDIAQYCEEHDIFTTETLPMSWIGVPLVVEEKIIGGLIVESYKREYDFWERDKLLLQAVAHQIAGAIKISQMSEEDRADSNRLEVMQKASAEMLKIGSKSTDKMWLAAMTIATASFGTGFNRALMFRFNYNRTQLIGRTAVGTDNTTEAILDWESDKSRKYGYEQFLVDLENNTIHHTDFEYTIKKVTFALSDGKAIKEAIDKNSRIIVKENEVQTRLPREITERFQLSECCILPLRAGEKILGVVLVDNKHNHRPLKPKSLQRLQTLLNNVSLAWENLHQQDKNDLLLIANYDILGESARKPLKDTLQRICDSAQVITEADWVIIYPLKKDASMYEFDVPHISYRGELKHPLEEVVKDKPRQKGVSAYIMRTGQLVVEDISKSEIIMPSNQKLSSHHFIHREGVKAMIGIPIREAYTSDPLGVFYLDYNSPRKFSEKEVNNATAFANMAGLAISNIRRQEKEHADEVWARQREREISHRMLEQALSSDKERDVLRALVINIRDAVQLPADALAIIMRTWEQRGKSKETKEINIAYRVSTSGETVGERLSSARLLKTVRGHNLYISPQRNVVCVPIKIAEHTIGAIYANVETVVSQEQIDILQRMAPVSALAMDNIRRQYHLRSLLDSAGTVTAAYNREETLERVAETVRQVSPEISAFIILYRDAESGDMKIGESYGLYQSRRRKKDATAQSAFIQTLSQRAEPIWAEKAKLHTEIPERFIREEKIISLVAFPLHTGEEPVGAMFFLYRAQHHFTSEEQTIFNILAQIVAGAIRDSIRLEEAQRQHERLQVTLDVAEAVSQILSPDETFKRVLSKLREIFDDTTLCILTYDEYTETLSFAPATLEFYKVENPDFQSQFSFPINGLSIASRVAKKSLQTRETAKENVGNVNADPNYLPLITSTKSELCVSLMIGPKLLGVLVLERSRAFGFTKDDEMLVENVAHQISTAIDRASQNEQLEFKSTVAAAYTWASDIAHDINREVGTIKNVAYLLGKTEPSREKIVEYAQKIKRSAQILSDAGSGPWNDQTNIDVGLDSFLRDNMSNLVNSSNIEIEFDLDASDVSLRTNPYAFQRILRHLTRNATQAMDSMDDKKIILRTRVLDDREVEIQFQDCGPGVRGDVQIFMFHHKVTTKGRTGGGFGLMNVRQMIEDMGGKIRLVPTPPGQGALFSITLPVHSANDKE